jgi:6-phospho-beta-glucosidase
MTLVPEHVVGGTLGDYPLYQANHYMFLAQSKTFALCHDMLPGALIGPAPNISVTYAATCDPKDQIAAQYANAIRNWIYLDAACLGRYNTLALDWVKRAGYSLEYTEEDLRIFRDGKPDFIAFNYYNTDTVAYVEGTTLVDEAGEIHGPGERANNPYLTKTDWNWWIDPLGFRTTLAEVHSRYNLPMMITENGLGAYDKLEEGNVVNDDYRIAYLRDHIAQLDEAVASGIPVIGYSPWSVMDLISTHEGFLKRYGFIYVNRNNDSELDLARYKKKSFFWYRKVIDSNGIDLA